MLIFSFFIFQQSAGHSNNPNLLPSNPASQDSHDSESNLSEHDLPDPSGGPGAPGRSPSVHGSPKSPTPTPRSSNVHGKRNKKQRPEGPKEPGTGTDPNAEARKQILVEVNRLNIHLKRLSMHIVILIILLFEPFLYLQDKLQKVVSLEKKQFSCSVSFCFFVSCGRNM